MKVKGYYTESNVTYCAYCGEKIYRQDAKDKCYCRECGNEFFVVLSEEGTEE